MTISSRHILSNFEEAMRQLRADILHMASLAQQNLHRAMQGFLDRNSELCSQAIADDEEVDQLEKRIDMEGMRILTLFQPVAADLRQVISIMKVSTNLERVSDEAGNIARRARKILANAEISESKLIEPAYQLAAQLLRDSVRAFADHNLTLAGEVNRRDDQLDESHNSLVLTLRKRMEEDVARLKDYLDLMFMVRSLERIGDHATNIAEDTIYVESAEDVRHQPKPH